VIPPLGKRKIRIHHVLKLTLYFAVTSLRVLIRALLQSHPQTWMGFQKGRQDFYL